jgi:hypothetical protein
LSTVPTAVFPLLAVSDDNGNKLPFVEIKLLDSTLAFIRTTLTADEIGAYVFKEVEPDKYTVVEVNPNGFPPSSLSDYDNSPNGNVADSSDTEIDNSIGNLAKTTKLRMRIS